MLAMKKLDQPIENLKNRNTPGLQLVIYWKRKLKSTNAKSLLICKQNEVRILVTEWEKHLVTKFPIQKKPNLSQKQNPYNN